MPTAKKHTTNSHKRKIMRKAKSSPEVVIVTKTVAPANETLFPEKLERVNKMLEKTTFLA